MSRAPHRTGVKQADLGCDCCLHCASRVGLDAVIVLTAGGDLQEGPTEERARLLVEENTNTWIILSFCPNVRLHLTYVIQSVKTPLFSLYQLCVCVCMYYK